MVCLLASVGSEINRVLAFGMMAAILLTVIGWVIEGPIGRAIKRRRR